MVERHEKRRHGVAAVPFTIHTSSSILLFFNTAPPGSCKKAIAQKVLFSISLVVKFGDFNYDEKIIDNSTYIVGIYMLHGSGAFMLYRCGAVVLSSS